MRPNPCTRHPAEPRRQPHLPRTVLLNLTLLCLGLATVASAQGSPAATSAAPPSEAPFVQANGLDLAEQRVIDVYETVSPSVVSITTQVLQATFFNGVVPEQGAGSGFVLDADGHVLTNYHVIRGAQKVTVSFEDGTTAPATLVGQDPRNDVAVLKVDVAPEELSPVVLGDSDALEVGQRAIAIGNPFGEFGRTLTTGVVSALNRTIQGPAGLPITGIIQTDAAINKGNSGGPLLDSSGRVIGITSAIFSPSGTNAGVGFVLPVNTVLRVLPSLLASGRYPHPYLGVRYAHALTPAIARALGLPTTNGLLLVQLDDGSPLAEAGTQGATHQAVIGNRRYYVGGDVLTEVNDHAVTDLGDLKSYLESNTVVGDEVTVTLVHDGATRTVTVRLAEEP